MSERTALVAEILATYCVLRWEMRDDDLVTTVRRARRELLSRQEAGSSDEDHRVGVRLGFAVSRVLRVLPTESACLMRSLVLLRLLARRGLSCSLVVGVSTAPKFAAHAWIEQSGRSLLPSYNPVFTRLVEL